ncbi:MAG: hypothetical protein P1U54_14880, partial [Immundisolibacteraceae bacterium]|nr:hypothetical protein [Immundisolibacteraceae bacterium]
WEGSLVAIRLSNGLRTALYGQYGITAMMQYGFIEVYSGTQPTDANAEPTGTLLGRITNNGVPHVTGTSTGGLTLTQDTNGRLTSLGAWRLTGIASGTAGWWRWKWNAPDDDSLSLYYPRIDGDVGTALVLANTAITAATDEEISSFILVFTED